MNIISTLHLRFLWVNSIFGGAGRIMRFGDQIQTFKVQNNLFRVLTSYPNYFTMFSVKKHKEKLSVNQQ